MTYEQAFPNQPALSFHLEPRLIAVYHRCFSAALILGSKSFWGVKLSCGFRPGYQEGEPIYKHRASLGLSIEGD